MPDPRRAPLSASGVFPRHGTTTELMERRQTPAESEARLRTIVDNAMDGIITIDEQGLMLDFNPRSGARSGRPAKRITSTGVPAPSGAN